MFRALGIVQFITDPSIGDMLSDVDQAILLMLLRDSCVIGPQAVLTWQTAPAAAYKLFVQQYSHSFELLRDSLFRQYQALNFNRYERSLADFNAMFNNIVIHLTLFRFNIDLIDKANQYLKSLEAVFLSWAERQRSSFRTMRAIGASVTALNLEFFMADILKEQRNLAFTTSKRTYVHKANRTFKDPIYQSKGFKCIESSRLSNRRRRPNRGFSYNTLSEDDDDKVSKEVEIELKSDLDLELESFTYIIRNFDLDNSKSSCSTSSLSFKNNVEDSETEDSYLAIFKK